MLYRNNPDLAVRFAQDGIRYGVSVGRRQPMHRVHLDCLKEILAHGLKLICVHGSENPPGSPFHDPANNPLTLPQRIEQVERVLPGEGIIHLSLADRGDVEKWSDDLVALLGDKLPHCVFHYRKKHTDAMADGAIRPLSQTVDALMKRGLAVWESENPRAADDAVHSAYLRTLDWQRLTPEQAALFADPEFIKTIIRK